MYLNGDNITYFDSFEVEHISKEILKKKQTANISKIQEYDSIICKYFCIGFMAFMLKGKTLLDYINLFLLNKY